MRTPRSRRWPRCSKARRAESRGRRQVPRQPIRAAPAVEASRRATLPGVIASRASRSGRDVRHPRRAQRRRDGRGCSTRGASSARARDAVRGALADSPPPRAGRRARSPRRTSSFSTIPSSSPRRQNRSHGQQRRFRVARSDLRASIAALRDWTMRALRERADDLLTSKRRCWQRSRGGAATTDRVPERRSCSPTTSCRRSSSRSTRARIAGLCTARGGADLARRDPGGARWACRCSSDAAPRFSTIADGHMARARRRAAAACGSIRRATQVAAAEREPASAHASEAAERAAAQTPTAAPRDGARIESLRQPRLARRGAERGRARRRRLRPAAHRVPVPRPPDRARSDEQAARIPAIVDAFGGRPVVIRTLDAGGDKPIAYLPLPREDNPALGLRGVRTSLWRPELLRAQLRGDPARPAARRMPDHAADGHRRRRDSTRVRAMLDETRARLGMRGASGARRHDRDAGGGDARRPALRRRRLPLDRHQRPHAVRARDGPRAPGARARSSTRCIRPCCG